MTSICCCTADYRLHIPLSTMENLNLPDNLEKLKQKVFDHIKQWQPVRTRDANRPLAPVM